MLDHTDQVGEKLKGIGSLDVPQLSEEGFLALVWRRTFWLKILSMITAEGSDPVQCVFRRVSAFTSILGFLFLFAIPSAFAHREISISGTVYLADEVTPATTANGGPCDGSTDVIEARSQGRRLETTSCSSSDASYTISEMLVNNGNMLTLNLTSSSKANTVTVTPRNDLTGMNLMIDHVIVRVDRGNSPLRIRDLDEWDQS